MLKIRIVLMCMLFAALFAGCNNLINAVENDAGSLECTDTDCVPAMDDASLKNLIVDSGTLSPEFSKDVTGYTLAISLFTENISLVPVASDELATIEIKNKASDIDYASGDDIYIKPQENTLIITVTAQDGITTETYTVIADRNIQKQSISLKASNADKNDQFMFDMSANGNTLIIGSPYEDSGDPLDPFDNVDEKYSSGAAYVFIKDGDTWTQQAYLKASNLEGIAGDDLQGDHFGFSVAVYNDIVAVGAPGESSSSTTINSGQSDNSASRSGAVYIFIRSGGVWSQEAYIKPHNTSANSQFGHSVALYENTLVVGSPCESTVSLCSGAVYVFERNSGIWTQKQHLTVANAGWGDWLGWYVDINGDIIVAGSPNEDSITPGINNTGSSSGNDYDPKINYDSGALYVFSKISGTWSETAYLKPSSQTSISENDLFGNFFKIVGNTIVAASRNGAGGSVFVFKKNTSDQTWQQAQQLKVTYYTSSTFYVYPAISQDEKIIAFGAPGDCSDATGVSAATETNNSINASGAVFLFIYDTITDKWKLATKYMKLQNPVVDDAFGWRVQFVDNMIVTGAALENSVSADSGAVYVFE